MMPLVWLGVALVLSCCIGLLLVWVFERLARWHNGP